VRFLYGGYDTEGIRDLEVTAGDYVEVGWESTSKDEGRSIGTITFTVEHVAEVGDAGLALEGADFQAKQVPEGIQHMLEDVNPADLVVHICTYDRCCHSIPGYRNVLHVDKIRLLTNPPWGPAPQSCKRRKFN
jgi:hypothetical protein